MGTQLQKFDMSLPVGSLDAYIHWANQVPILSEQEELDLATRLHENDDLEAAKRLALAHLRFVIKIARGYLGYGLALSDLIQEGNIGLIKAIKRFDPKIGVRLVSFAVHWIKAEIHEFVLRNWRIVKVATTKAQRKLFFNLRSAKKHLGWFSKEEIQDVADTLNVEPKTVMEMEARMNAHDAGFDSPIDEDESYTAPANYLEDTNADPANLVENSDWTLNSTSNLYEAYDKLDSRAQTIVKRRFLDDNKATLHDLATEFGVSAERIRQLEQQALEKLKKLLQ